MKTEENQSVCIVSSETKSENSKFQIPDEILLKIFAYCPVETILKKIVLVDKHFYELSQDPYLIKTLSLNVELQRHLNSFFKFLPNLKGLEILKINNALRPESVLIFSYLLQRSQKLKSLQITDDFDIHTFVFEVLEYGQNIMNLDVEIKDCQLHSHSITDQYLPKGLNVLVQMTNLKKLRIGTTAFHTKLLVKLAENCTGLESLKIFSNEEVIFFSEKHEIKSSFDRFFKLISKRLKCFATNWKNVCLDSIDLCETLQELTILNSQNISNDEMCKIPKLTKMKVLKLKRSIIRDQELSEFFESFDLSQTTEMYLEFFRALEPTLDTIQKKIYNLKFLTSSIEYSCTPNPVYHNGVLYVTNDLNSDMKSKLTILRRKTSMNML